MKFYSLDAQLLREADKRKGLLLKIFLSQAFNMQCLGLSSALQTPVQALMLYCVFVAAGICRGQDWFAMIGI